VPDDAFEAFLIWYGYDDVLDDSVDTDHISSAVTLDIGFSSNSGTIYDLTGIEGFSSLKTLICNYNQLTSLDVSQNTELENLNCLNNQLTSLNVDGGSLILLSCQNNQLTNLDVSQNIGLTNLYCDNNPLTNLDVSQNTALQLLYCTHQQLTSLDLSNNADLRSLRCYGNQLSNLDLSHNNALYMLQCGQNLITSLDLSQNPDIEGLWCEENQLTSLHLSNHGALYTLNCESNHLSCLNIANGNNTNFLLFKTTNNNNLDCIEVDDPAWSAANWTYTDPQTSFSVNCNYPSNCFSTVTITEQTNNINLYPNPTNNLITLYIEGYNGSVNVEVYDLQGRLLETTTNTTISMGEYAKGIYVFKVAYGDRTQELKVVKE